MIRKFDTLFLNGNDLQNVSSVTELSTTVVIVSKALNTKPNTWFMRYSLEGKRMIIPNDF